MTRPYRIVQTFNLAVILVGIALLIVLVWGVPAEAHDIAGHYHTVCPSSTYSHGKQYDGNGWGHDWFQVAGASYDRVVIGHYQRYYSPESGTYSWSGVKHTTEKKVCWVA